jgi:hypothetical protein
MRHCLVILFTLVLILGCERNKPGKDLIPPETLVPVLVDLHLVYAIQSSSAYRDILNRVDSVDTYSYVFEKYGVKRVAFDSTIAWYSRHPKMFTDIYDEVVMQLSRRIDSLQPAPY